MSSKDIVRNLALAIEVDPNEILGYRNYYDKGYTVMLKDYRKFTGVQPASDIEVAVAFDNKPDDSYPAGMPIDLRPIYYNPRNYKVQDLRRLAYFLPIQDASALKKAPLIEEIESWKVAFSEGI